MPHERQIIDLNLNVNINFPDAGVVREFRHALAHQHLLLHEILRASLGDDPTKVEAITAKLKASADALTAATNAAGAAPPP